jgi:hypothetical protein
LGEVFSRQQTKKLDRLGIKLRRVLSNLDDDATFTKTVGYLPRHVAFTTAGADLLKLLIQPLYGDRPEIGVRELVQNAVDAVRELDSLRERGFVPNGLDLVEQEADVVVMLEEIEDDWWLTVSDRGIGMSSEVICGYFLRAGASFRRSEAWQRQFGEKGRPLVLRTGRFGIGALAAFLLGQEIHVSTRHVSESSGLAFLAGIDTDPIEVRQVQSPVGTTVRVRLFPEIAKSLVNTRVQRSPAFMELEERLRWSRKIDRGNDTWDWYCLATPSVARKIKPDGVLIPQRYMLPGPGETLPPHWRRLADTEFEDVHWSYAEAPPLTCNGIVVLTDPPSLGLDTVAGMKFRMPAVSVFDRDGGLALTLQRTGLTTNRYPFEKRLVTDVINDYVAFSLATAPDAPVTMTGDPAWYLGGQYTGCHSLGDGVGMWGSCEGGIVPIQGAITSCLELRSVLILPLLSSIGRGRFYIPRIRTRTDSAIVIVESTVHQGVTRFHETAPKDSFIKSYRMVFDLFLKTMLGFETEMEERLGQEVLGIRFTIPVDFLPEFSRLSELQSLVNHFVYEHAGGQAIWSTGECAAMDKFIPVIDQFDRVGRKPFGVAVEFYLGPATKRVSDDLFSRVWNSVVGNPIIPYDRAERKRMLASAFRKLTPYMEANAHQEPSGGA